MGDNSLRPADNMIVLGGKKAFSCNISESVSESVSHVILYTGSFIIILKKCNLIATVISYTMTESIVLYCIMLSNAHV